jgi:hypothetical protein
MFDKINDLIDTLKYEISILKESNEEYKYRININLGAINRKEQHLNELIKLGTEQFEIIEDVNYKEPQKYLKPKLTYGDSNND